MAAEQLSMRGGQRVYRQPVQGFAQRGAQLALVQQLRHLLQDAPLLRDVRVVNMLRVNMNSQCSAALFSFSAF